MKPGNLVEPAYCIYCGADRYSPDREALAEEHITPSGIGGRNVVPYASCKLCEEETGRWEQLWFRGNLDSMRTFHGLQDRRRAKRRLKEKGPQGNAQPIFDSSTKPDRKINVALEDYPVGMIMPIFGAPRIFNPMPPPDQHYETWIHSHINKAEAIVAKYGLTKFATGSLDVWAMCRVLAKIAHAFTVNSLGIKGFVPLLPHYIMGNNDAVRFAYVGSQLAMESADPEFLHRVAFEEPTTEQWEFWVVNIRLFAQFGAPSYRVVSGYRLAPTKPLEVLLDEVNALRTPLGRLAQYRTNPPMPAGLWDRAAPSSGAAPLRGPQRYLRTRLTHEPRTKK